MKAHGMLMSAPMVLALLRHRDPKRETRRVVTDSNTVGSWKASQLDLASPRTFVDHGFPDPVSGIYTSGYIHAPLIPQAQDGFVDHGVVDRLYPRYQVGDTLYVKETWGSLDDMTEATKADPGTRALADGCFYAADFQGVSGIITRWRPSIFMPRKLSRITLEIIAVRIERLQAITEADAVAEGIARNGQDTYWLGAEHRVKGSPKVFATAVQAYADLWDAINCKKAPWASDPYVVVTSFKRLQQ